MTEFVDRYDEHYPHLQHLQETVQHPSTRVWWACRTFAEVYLPLRLRPGNKVLEVGSCIGYTGHYLTYGGISTFGIDLNLAAFAVGRSVFGREKNNTPTFGRSERLPFANNSFDAVISIDLLEHMEGMVSLQKTFSEMARTCRGPRMVHKVTVLEDTDWIHQDKTHYIKESANWWRTWFEQQGWKVIAPTTRRILAPWLKKRIEFMYMHGYFLLERK